MSFVERIVGRSEPYLYERDVQPDHLNRLDERIRHAAFVWAKEAVTFRRDPAEIIRAGVEAGKNESMVSHVIDGMEFLSAMDLADRASNGLRLSLLTDNRDNTQTSSFGTYFMKALNDPRLSDHNHEHNRRLERWLEAMFLNIGRLRHGDSVLDWQNSAFLYAYFHDADQIISLERNFDRSADSDTGELSVKKGHALGAAVMLLALHERYAAERVIRKRDAWETCAGAAYMVIRHDVPEAFMDILKARERAYVSTGSEEDYFHGNQMPRILLAGRELREKYYSNSLDLTTLSPSQMVDLLIHEKSQAGKFIGPGSKYGLMPEFETEYASELSKLAQNHDPLFRQLTPDRLESLKRTSEVAIRADLMDMVAPPAEEIFRKLATQYSRNRPFFRPYREIIKSYQAVSGLHVPSDLHMRQALKDPGNIDISIDSDMRRVLWELVHIEQVSPESEIGKSPYIRKVNRDNSIMGLMVFRDLGIRIMQGDYSGIESVYGNRINEIAVKVLTNAGIPMLTKMKILADAKKQGTMVSGITGILLKKGHHQLAKRFFMKTEQLLEELDGLKMNLAGKPGPEGGIYGQDDINEFREVCDRMLDRMCAAYGVSQRERKRYRIKVLDGKFPTTTPYKRYDSIADQSQIRTLVKPLQALK